MFSPNFLFSNFIKEIQKINHLSQIKFEIKLFLIQILFYSGIVLLALPPNAIQF